LENKYDDDDDDVRNLQTNTLLTISLLTAVAYAADADTINAHSKVVCTQDKHQDCKQRQTEAAI